MAAVNFYGATLGATLGATWCYIFQQIENTPDKHT